MDIHYYARYCLRHCISCNDIIESGDLPRDISLDEFKIQYREMARKRLQRYKRYIDRKGIKPHTKNCYKSIIKFLENEVMSFEGY